MFKRVILIGMAACCIIAVCIAKSGFASAFLTKSCQLRWVNPPCNKTTYQKIDQFLKITDIPNNPFKKTTWKIKHLPVEKLVFNDAHNQPMSIDQWLNTSSADAFVVIKDGELVAERYTNGMTPSTRHIMFSVTKSFTGTLASYVINQHHIPLEDNILKYIPELSGSAFADYSVQDVLEMNNHIQYSEDYENPSADFYSLICSVTPQCAQKDKFPNIRNFLSSLKATPNPTRKFDYETPATDVLMWFIEKVSKKSFQALFYDVLWSKIGAEHSAHIITDDQGVAFAGAGLSITARDAARFGQLMLNRGYFNQQQILPTQVVDVIAAGGDRNFFAKSEADSKVLPGGSYNYMWWMTENVHKSYMALGIYGQMIYIDPVSKVVMVKQSSLPFADADDNLINAFRAMEKISTSL